MICQTAEGESVVSGTVNEESEKIIFPNSGETATPTAKLIPKIPLKLCAREYCDAIISNELNGIVSEMLTKLLLFQIRAKQKTPKKAKKRIVLGVREVERSVLRRRSKCIIIAYNIEQSESLNEVVDRIKVESAERGIPVIYALKKSALGKAVGKRMNMSFASVVCEDGAHDLYKQVLQLSDALRKEKLLIDAWLLECDLNDCGDPSGTEYENNPRKVSGANTLMD
eukprot:CAMPEP_0117059872 /NCGR_PEP_ID=MMETSP0472-20121206/41617_1 /TAXON_ID=693140 ORGANISM="Tiarina fusus, Strain LIS" /NCGR_SAMPLE_ID=MMETSP0472 /ASSEMBLY_ACC=CAM_ASM_000603 /LENGTH=225 /DNA_ID=CAMNT_0004777805 /DNA_START=507 /DNA_END=1181 /DNA_ORIENTATION=-